MTPVEEQDWTRRQTGCPTAAPEPATGGKPAPLPRRVIGSQAGVRRQPPRIQRPPHIAILHPLPARLAKPISQDAALSLPADSVAPDARARTGEVAGDIRAPQAREERSLRESREERSLRERSAPDSGPAMTECPTIPPLTGTAFEPAAGQGEPPRAMLASPAQRAQPGFFARTGPASREQVLAMAWKRPRASEPPPATPLGNPFEHPRRAPMVHPAALPDTAPTGDTGARAQPGRPADPQPATPATPGPSVPPSGQAGPPAPSPEPSGQAGPPAPSPEPSGQAGPPAPSPPPSGQAAPSPEPPAVGQPAVPAPPWRTVLLTTLRLWLHRRTGRLTPSRGMRAAVVLAVAVVAAVAATAVTMALRHPAADPAGGAGHGQRGPGQSSGGLVAGAVVRGTAARWIARDISPSAIVACDPAMCAALHTDGIPGTNLLVLGPSSPDPLGADIVVATPAIRSQFGARLSGVYAPLLLASFGSGSGRIGVRVVAVDGAAAYRAAMASDLQARKAAGEILLTNSRIQLEPAARAQLAAGQVDPRLLLALPVLANMHQVRIVGFSGLAVRGSPDVPLTTVLLAASDQQSGMSAAKYRHWLSGFFGGQRSQYRADAISVSRAAATAVVVVRFDLPSPPGLLGN